jgi:hypothetical protein
MLFSLEIFKKGMKKEFFIPTLFVTIVTIIFQQMVSDFLPKAFFGKHLIGLFCFYGAFFILVFSLRCQLLKKKILVECWNFPFSLPVLTAFMLSIGLFVLGTFFYYLKWMPLFGSIFSLLLCGVDFLLKMGNFILAPLMLLSLFLAGKNLQKDEKFSIKGHLVDITSAIQDSYVIKKMMKAAGPLAFFSLIAFTVYRDSLFYETSELKGLIEIVLAIVMSFLMTPWINYFILVSFIKSSTITKQLNKPQLSVSK